MTRIAPALYGSSNPDSSWNDPSVRALLDLVRPPILQEHGGWAWLRDSGGKLAAKIRVALPGTDPWFTVQGDGAGADPGPEWTDAAKAAVDAGVGVFCVDSETTKYMNGVVRKALESMRAACPGLRIVVTTFGQPAYVPNVMPPPSGDTGYSNDFAKHELAEMLGIGSPVTGSLNQVYYTASKEDPPIPTERGRGPRSNARSVANYATTIANGYVRTDMEMLGYQQIHGCRTDDLCTVGVQYEICGFWALSNTPGYRDSDGEKAMRAMAELHRRGYDGPGAIMNFQRDQGLVVDNIMGPKTLAALGIY